MIFMIYDIVKSGSSGNAVVIEGYILIDCGVSYRNLNGYADKLRLVLLTHIHGDHFKKSTVAMLAGERPTLRFCCGVHMVSALLSCGVRKTNIDVVQGGYTYHYGTDLLVSPVALVHDVPNFGWKISISGEKLFYATDTANLSGIEAKNYDLYMIECNYDSDEIARRIEEKQKNGDFCYEIRAREQHLSRAQCDAFIYQNIGANGRYIYMHRHRDKEAKNA